MKKLILVVGARPNFMKIAPLMHALKGHSSIQPILVHTGQHYDIKMSGQFFTELNIPHPDVNLEVGSASHAVQMARIMEGFEQVCIEQQPDYVLVVGDVNSTAACTMVAAKLGIKAIHYEAGVRSYDRSMPEEINRLVTDAISDMYFTTGKDANEILKKEGVSTDKIYLVGNLMIDALVENLENASKTELSFTLLDRDKNIALGVDFLEHKYGVMTFHRPANVDNPDSLEKLIHIWGQVSKKVSLIFPVHPRTYKNIQNFGLLPLLESYPQLYFIEPLGYLSFINLIQHAAFTMTDSGGVQTETTFLNVPCLTVRLNTEWTITVSEGSNKLISVDDIIPEVDLVLAGHGKHGKCPQYWDGQAAGRIVEILEKL